MEEYYTSKMSFMKKRQTYWDEKLQIKREKNEIHKDILAVLNDIKESLF